MPNPEHLAILQRGTATWNAWRQEHPETVPDLIGAQYVGTDFRLAYSDLAVRPDLSHANLRLTDFRGANLSGVDFRLSDLRDADLRDADLTWALCNATNLTHAYLKGADFTSAVFESTLICNVDLGEVKGLEKVQHQGPSLVDIGTIYRSQGEIPEAFLRLCGVPDTFITFTKSLVGRANEFYSCFISYSMKDEVFSDRLCADLRARGIRCWFAPHDIQGGKKIQEQIDTAIRVYDRLLLILSDASMSSEWVKTEIAHARQREIHEKRQMLFPIGLIPYDRIKEWKAFDAETGKDSAREIREYFIPDFSNWKDHDSYQQAFQRLLRDLKAEASRE